MSSALLQYFGKKKITFLEKGPVLILQQAGTFVGTS